MVTHSYVVGKLRIDGGMKDNLVVFLKVFISEIKTKIYMDKIMTAEFSSE